eukprot:s906_g11.t1
MLITSVEDFKEVEVRIPALSKLKHDLGRVRFDYSGEMVAVMEDLTADSVIACWPGVGEAGIQPAEKFVTEEVREWLTKPRSTLLPRCYWPERPPKSRVAEEDILCDGAGRLILNGAGAVPKYKVIDGQEVKLQRFISILVPSNSYQEHMPGDDRHLPYLGQLSMLELSESHELLIDSEDLTSCFNLFSLPPSWAGMMTFSKQVSSAVFGGSPDQLSWVGMRVVPMGWINSVSLMQTVVRQLVFAESAIPLSSEISKMKRFPEDSSASLVYLDSYDEIRKAGLIGYGLMLLSQSKVTEFELRHFAGKALFNLAFRRPAMSLFESVFYDIERLAHSSEARALAPATKDEIFLVLALTPLLRMNLRAVVDGEVTITDASPLGAGGGVSNAFKRAPDTVEHDGAECFYCHKVLGGPKYPCPAECNAMMCSLECMWRHRGMSCKRRSYPVPKFGERFSGPNYPLSEAVGQVGLVEVQPPYDLTLGHNFFSDDGRARLEELENDPDLLAEHWAPCCKLFSRARGRPVTLDSGEVIPGPQAVRDAKHPMGFPWLNRGLKQRLRHSNTMANRSFGRAKKAHEEERIATIEHPYNSWL